jgi:hypothetical protein
VITARRDPHLSIVDDLVHHPVLVGDRRDQYPAKS